MECVWIILISIVIIALISLIVVIIVVATNKGSNVNSQCTSQIDCQLGYVCSDIGTGGTGICLAGFGTVCGTNTDCADNLTCVNSRCINEVVTTVAVSNMVSKSISTVVLPTLTPQVLPQASPQVLPQASSNNYTSTVLPSGLSTVPSVVPSVIPSVISPVVKDTVIEEKTTRIIDQMNEHANPVDKAVTPFQMTPRQSTPLTSRQPTPLVVVQYGKELTPKTATSKTVTFDDKLVTSTKQPTAPTLQIFPKAPIRKAYNTETTSVDDEINSVGFTRNIPFDVRSADTPMSPLVSSPYEEQNGVFYCRNNAEDILTDKTHSPVIDVCSYSNVTVFLLQDGNIICETQGREVKNVKDAKEAKQRRRVSNNISLVRITSFNGYLYGLENNGKLYNLPNTHFPSLNWIWNLAEWAPKDIEHLSSTYDSNNLWIQTINTGYLYNGPNALVSQYNYVNKRRVYGRNVSNYIDIDPVRYTAQVYPSNKIVTEVYDGALSYYDEVVAIHPKDMTQYRRIAVVNWKPYYIRA